MFPFIIIRMIGYFRFKKKKVQVNRPFPKRGGANPNTRKQMPRNQSENQHRIIYWRRKSTTPTTSSKTDDKIAWTERTGSNRLNYRLPLMLQWLWLAGCHRCPRWPRFLSRLPVCVCSSNPFWRGQLEQSATKMLKVPKHSEEIQHCATRPRPHSTRRIDVLCP